jgi:homoserine dehydrogenase
MKTVKAAFIGLGSVNRNLLQILSDKSEILRKQYGLRFSIVCVADSTGVAVDTDGFDAAAICAHKKRGKSVKALQGFEKNALVKDVLKNLDYDILFEASPVNLKTGGPALALCEATLSRGLSVVLANKGPIVVAYKKLHQLARTNGAELRYSATVCGGLPILSIGTRDMICGQVEKLSGVFNATSNFILESMVAGRTYAAALKEAQERGVAEADPSLDVDGKDTAFKLLIIANTIMGANISLSDIEITGITGITEVMLKKEEKKGNTIKLLAQYENGKYTVKPTILKQSEFLAQCNGWEMGVEIHSDIYGIGYYKLWEREPIPTAASMMRDAVNIFAEIGVE